MDRKEKPPDGSEGWPRLGSKSPDGADVTETIDLGQFLARDLTMSGSFDLSQLNHASFGKLLEALSVPTLLITRSHSIRFANAAFRRLAKQGFRERPLTFASLFRTPKEARQAQLILETVFQERQPQVKERILQIQGTRVWARMHLRTVRAGSEHFVLAQIENLTAQKQLLTIQKYRKLVRIFPIGIAEMSVNRPLECSMPLPLLLDAIVDARIIDGNNEFARLHGRRNISDLLGSSLGRLFPPKGRRKDLYENWIRGGFPIVSFESKEQSLADWPQYYENTLIGNVSKDKLLGFWWLRRDISEKKRAEQEILRAQKLESLGILAGGIAHDFNNLLTGILGNISLAITALEPTHKARGRLEAAAKASSRAQELTRQLLTFSQGGAPIKKTASIGELLRDSVVFALRGSNVKCEFNLPADLWHIEMDEGQIHQVINNLVINAVQAMPDGGVISVSAENLVVVADSGLPLKPGRFARISIKDTGVGIPQEYLQKIFDPYFTTKEKGTGLGLATSYSVIRKHDGLITVESQIGDGSTFHFLLPASSDILVSEGAAEEKAVSGRGRILVMDDDEVIRDMAGELLTLLGYEAAFANDGYEAIEAYNEARTSGNPFDAVIMDLTVPGGMGGKATMEKLREIDPHIKAIVSSGYSNDPIMADYRKSGFVGVLPKPYSAQDLSKLLRGILT